VTAKLRVVVADDERPARSFLVALLRSFKDVAVVGEAASGKEAVALIEREKPDLALLDWQMPELDGIGVVRVLKRDSMPLIAFVTAYDQFAVKAFEVNAVDHLLKPVDKARLRETLNRAEERIEHDEIVAEQASRVDAAIAAYETTSKLPYLQRIPVCNREEVTIVPVAQIASIVAEGELLHIATTRNERTTHDQLSSEGSGTPPRPPTVHSTRPRHARERGVDHEGQRHARRHARGRAQHWPGAARQPAPVAGPAGAPAQALTRHHSLPNANR
jgi:two-component system, LytTR family, response regulator